MITLDEIATRLFVQYASTIDEKIKNPPLRKKEIEFAADRAIAEAKILLDKLYASRMASPPSPLYGEIKYVP